MVVEAAETVSNDDIQTKTSNKNFKMKPSITQTTVKKMIMNARLHVSYKKQ